MGGGGGSPAVQGQAQWYCVARAYAQRLRCGLGGEGKQEDLWRGGERSNQGGCRWASEGNHQFRAAALGVQRFHADGLLELSGRGADDGHGRRLGEGCDVVRQRVGLLAACYRPHSHCGGKVASGGLKLGAPCSSASIKSHQFPKGVFHDTLCRQLVDLLYMRLYEPLREVSESMQSYYWPYLLASPLYSSVALQQFSTEVRAMISSITMKGCAF